VIQGGMNLVWTTRAVHDRVFCDGTTKEAIASADTRVTAASGLCTREPCFALSETDEACSGAAEADPRGRNDVGDELVQREPSGAWPEAPSPGF